MFIVSVGGDGATIKKQTVETQRATTPSPHEIHLQNYSRNSSRNRTCRFASVLEHWLGGKNIIADNDL